MASSYQTALDVALQELQTARSSLLSEIADYPTPISGCDAQFNHLLSDRTRIAQALQALESCPFVPTPRMLEPCSVVQGSTIAKGH
jgi:hypothetical protein